MENFEFYSSRQVIPVADLLQKVDDLPSRFIHILENMTFFSEEEFFQFVEQLYFEHTSRYLFPNRLISFYPQIRELHAKNNLTCNLSGSIIKKGSLYYSYHPFMEDVKSGRVYTISGKIKLSIGYEDLLPQNLFTYEEWYYRLKNAYYENNDSEIDFYGLSSICGEDCLNPYLLGISKKKLKSLERK